MVDINGISIVYKPDSKWVWDSFICLVISLNELPVYNGNPLLPAFKPKFLQL